MSKAFLYTGIISALYSLYAFASYYTYSGANLISSNIAKQYINNKKITLIIDVRTNTEYNLGHYPNSINIPVSEITKDKLNYPKDTSILVYCNTGQRARKASEIINSFGFTNVYYIAGTYKTII